MGFFWIFVLFLAGAIWYTPLVNHYLHLFQFMYYFSSFWGQWGPNATTWLIPSEVS